VPKLRYGDDQERFSKGRKNITKNSPDGKIHALMKTVKY
jgi:hypothetical protein